MSDDAKRHSNYRPGDDGNLTTGDFHKLIAEAFLSAMRPHYDMVAEEWKSARPKYKEQTAQNGVPPYVAFRAEWLEGVEQVERARAEQSVRKILALKAGPPTGKLSKASSLTDDAALNAPG